MSNRTVSIELEGRRVVGSLDFVHLIPGLGYLVSGWLVDSGGGAVGLALSNDKEEVQDFSDDCIWQNRPDVDEYCNQMNWNRSRTDNGFQALVQFEPELTGELRFRITLNTGDIKEVAFVPREVSPSEAPHHARQLAAELIPPRWDIRKRLDALGPAIEGLWSLRQTNTEAPTVVTFGQSAENPRISIVVPIYGRLDLTRYQLALFANDPELKRAELIYVLDDPTLADALFTQCKDWSELFGIGFTVVYPGENLGYSGANNAGVAVAKGRYLVLLNSDVMPKKIGWLGRLQRSLSQKPDAGAVGPVLLYEDEAIQHAGMSFAQHSPWGGLWINRHPMKGLSPSVLPEESFRVAALTGACIMMERRDYHRCGALDDGYIVGDYEDSDLCLRLLEHGLHCYIQPKVELYHLERGSHLGPTPDWRQGLTLYNCWRQTQRWHQMIETTQTSRAEAS